MGKALQYGLVGYGLNAVEHITEFGPSQLVGGTKLVAAFDPNPKAHEYIQKLDHVKATETFEDILDIAPAEYREFVEERKDYQRELKKIKDMLFD